jgi:integrase
VLHLSPESALVLERWSPRAHCKEAAEFARSVVAQCGPLGPSRCRTLLWCCASLARFGIGIGLEPVPGALLRPSVIERFVVVGLSSASFSRRRDVRTNLRHVARKVVPELFEPAPAPLSRSRAKMAYRPDEIAGYLALADAQPTVARRMRLQGLICLGAGAGLGGGDVRSVRGSDVVVSSGGVLVRVEGRSPRVVPVLSPYHRRLLESARFSGGGYLCGGRSASRRNVTNNLVDSISGGSGLERLEISRLRVTWLVTQATRLGLRGLFQAAGFSFSQQLCDLVARLEELRDDELVLLLGGRAEQA